MIRNILTAIQFLPYAITMIAAIVGAVMALIGAVSGWESLTEFGKTTAGLGAMGFFGWLLLQMVFPVFDVLNVLPVRKTRAQSNVAASGQKDKE